MAVSNESRQSSRILLVRVFTALVILALMMSGCISSEGGSHDGGLESVGREDGGLQSIAKAGRNVVNIDLPPTGGMVAHAWILPMEWQLSEISAERTFEGAGVSQPRWTMFHGMNSVLQDNDGALVFQQDSLVQYDYDYDALEGSVNLSVRLHKDAYAVWFVLMSTSAISGTVTLVVGSSQNSYHAEPVFVSPIASYESVTPSPIPSPATAEQSEFDSRESGAEILLIGYEAVTTWQEGPGLYEFASTNGEVRSSIVMAPGVTTRPNVRPSLDPVYGPISVYFVDYCAPSGRATLTAIATHGPAMLIPHYVRSLDCPLKMIDGALTIS